MNMLKLKRRNCLQMMVAGAAAAPLLIAAPPARPIQLHCDLAVDPKREQEMLDNFEKVFRPVARKQGWPPLNNGAKMAGSVIIAALMLTAVLWVIAWFASNGAALSAAIVATGTDLMIMFAAAAQLLESRRQHRS